MSWSARLGRWLIGRHPERLKEPTIDDVDHWLSVALSWRAEGRQWAPIPINDNIAILVALRESLEKPAARMPAPRHTRKALKAPRETFTCEECGAVRQARQSDGLWPMCCKQPMEHQDS